MFRRVATLAMLATAAGGPYVASETQWGRGAAAQVASLLSGDSQADADDSGSETSGNGTHAHRQTESLWQADPQQYRYDPALASKLGGLPADAENRPSLVGAEISDLREVLRFDITPEWVAQRFSRVSTVLADLKLKGLRVPIVTGTRADDMAGALTYYFDHSGELQRLTIHGFTGDPSRLIDTMTQHYGLQRERALEAGVLTRRWNGEPIHFLRLTHAPVIYSDAVHQKYTVFLELNQPNLPYGISQEARSIVQADHSTGLW